MNPASVSSTVRPSARRFSFRLPTVLSIAVSAVVFLVMTLGLLLGISAYRQQTTIGEIERLGGQCTTRHRGPKWLRDLAGKERMRSFDDVVEVSLRETPATDATLSYLNRLTGLRALSLEATQVTDAGLTHLQGLTRLQELDLDGTQVTDAGLARLSGLHSLQRLYLDGTHLTDAGLANLKILTNLQWLALDRTRVTDAGLDHLKDLPSLWWLMLEGTTVTDAGAGHLKRSLPRLTINK
jgi:hypothetical protein